VNPPRTLPIRLPPRPGEALDSWLEAIAHRLAVPLNDLMWAIGLPGGAHRRSNRPGTAERTVALPPAEAAAIAAATGLNEARVHAATLAHYDQRAVLLDPVTRLVNIRTLWGRSQGSRYCPGCLAAAGGRWQLRWRLSWSFACPIHQRLLADDCPACGQPQRVRSSAQHDPPQPGYCENPIHPAGHGPARGHVRCGADLSRAATIILPCDHPVLRVQGLLDDLLDTGKAAFGVYATQPQPALAALADIRAIAGRAIAHNHRNAGGPVTAPGSGDPVLAAIRVLAQAEHQRADARARLRPGTMAPPTAASAAVGLTTACGVLLAADLHAAAAALGWLITAPRPKGRIPSPSTVDDWGRGISPVLRGVQLAALGPRLRPTDQLRYRTASPAPREPSITTAAAAQRRAAVIPTLFWLSWTVRLCPPAGALITTVRPALSGALLLVGTRLNLTGAAELLGSATSCQPISKTVQLLHATSRWQDAAAALIRLAGHLDAHDIPIDYQRRRQLDYRRLLPATQWQRLCRQARAPRDPSVYAQAARCVLFEQLSGMPAHLAPFGAAASTPPFRAKMAQLAAVFTPDLASALRETAASFLASHGITSEPISWDPPLHLLGGLHLPGTDPAAVDIEHLHRLIRRDHVSLATAARRLGTTSETIQMLLLSHPAPPRTAARKPSSRPARELLPRDLLARQYLTEHMSLAQIGKQAGLSANTIGWLARDYGIPIRGQKDYTAHQHPVLTRDWLWHQHVTRGHSMQDIATATGLSKSTIRRWASLYRIPQQRRYPIRMNITAAAAAAPPPLRPAITGPGAWKRLHHLAEASRYPSLSHAATALGIHHTVLITQVKRLERELGQRLLERAPGQHTMRPTTYGRKIVTAIRTAERRQARRSRPALSD
jgi:molybdenum-dependent DNA-binding transcriptional regulator ModE